MDDKELFETYKEAVYRVCRYLLHSVSDAEDICQEVFVKALLADRSQIRNMKAWLLRIAVNESNTLLKRRARGRDKELGLFKTNHVIMPSPVEAEVERLELSYQFSMLFGRLPWKVREAMTLRYCGELSVKQTAAVLGVPEGTVKSRINRGLRRLRKLLQDSGTKKGGHLPWELPMKLK